MERLCTVKGGAINPPEVVDELPTLRLFGQLHPDARQVQLRYFALGGSMLLKGAGVLIYHHLLSALTVLQILHREVIQNRVWEA